MDNITEHEQTEGPLIGIAPFDAGIEEQGDDGDFVYIETKKSPFGALGEISLRFTQVSRGVLEEEVSEQDAGFTIGLDGKVHRGKLRDFYKKGYSAVDAYLYSTNPIIRNNSESLKANLWLDGTTPIIHADFFNYDSGDPDDFEAPYSIASFGKYDRNNRFVEELVLPNNPEILQAIRISVNSK